MQARYLRWPTENWYRDVWLFAVTAITLFAVLTSSHAANDAKRAAARANANVATIQASRISILRGNCRDQNARHDKALLRLRTLVGAISDPTQKRRARAGQAGTISLIEAIVPRRDCAAVASRVGPPPAVVRSGG